MCAQSLGRLKAQDSATPVITVCVDIRALDLLHSAKASSADCCVLAYVGCLRFILRSNPSDTIGVDKLA